jgi:hypothetical protein
MLSVSPYTTCSWGGGGAAPSVADEDMCQELAWPMHISKLSRPLCSTARLARHQGVKTLTHSTCTIASASSAHGILPLNDAAVYPYVTFAKSFSPNCRAFNVAAAIVTKQ